MLHYSNNTNRAVRRSMAKQTYHRRKAALATGPKMSFTDEVRDMLTAFEPVHDWFDDDVDDDSGSDGGSDRGSDSDSDRGSDDLFD